MVGVLHNEARRDRVGCAFTRNRGNTKEDHSSYTRQWRDGRVVRDKSSRKEEKERTRLVKGLKIYKYQPLFILFQLSSTPRQ